VHNTISNNNLSSKWSRKLTEKKTKTDVNRIRHRDKISAIEHSRYHKNPWYGSQSGSRISESISITAATKILMLTERARCSRLHQISPKSVHNHQSNLTYKQTNIQKMPQKRKLFLQQRWLGGKYAMKKTAQDRKCHKLDTEAKHKSKIRSKMHL